MNKIILYTAFIILCVSCKNDRQPLTSTDTRSSESEVAESFIDWWGSYQTNIELHRDFNALDFNGSEISKGEFLQTLTLGKHIPVNLESNRDEITYQLKKLPVKADKNISSTIRNEALTFLHYFNLQGRDFPDFIFSDLADNKITSADLIGKTTIFKTWFINCHACIEEFPACNELVGKYAKDPDIQFISLATDDNDKLVEFLKSKELTYQTVGEQGDLIQNVLGLNVYPTHLLVGPDGKILKVVNNFGDFVDYLEEDYHLDSFLSDRKANITPPPPAS